MSFLWSSVFSAVGGILGGWGRLGLIAGVASLVLGTAYVKGRVHGSDSTERKLRPVIVKLETDNRTLLRAIDEVNKEREKQDEELDNSRKAADDVQLPNRNNDEWLRKARTYPGSYNSQ